MMTHRISVIAGDGIGQEVVPAAIEVLDAVAEIDGFALTWEYLPWSCEQYLATGKMMPDDGIELLRRTEAVFLGAIGAPGVPDHVSLWDLLIPIRREFHQYVNLRPVKLLRGVTSPLREAKGIDCVVVRENNEGEYSRIGGRIYDDTPHEIVVQDAIFTRRGVERILRYAFELARTRDGRLCAATKSNGIVHSMPFWDQVCHEIEEEYPDVSMSLMHVDALAAKLVLAPQSFDVIVASNLFGDILTDLGAAVVGSIGIAPSANLNPEREHPSMFEPIHGSAPDIAGMGVANPIGQIWSGAMMLEHLGHPESAKRTLDAVESVLGDRGVRTRDLGGDADTATVTAAVLGALHD